MHVVQSFDSEQVVLLWHTWILVQKARVLPAAMHLAQLGWHEAQHLSVRRSPLYLETFVSAPTSDVKQEPPAWPSCFFSFGHAV